MSKRKTVEHDRTESLNSVAFSRLGIARPHGTNRYPDLFGASDREIDCFGRTASSQ